MKVIFRNILVLTFLLNVVYTQENNIFSSKLSEESFLQLPFEHDWRSVIPKCFESDKDDLGQGVCTSSFSFSIEEMMRLRLCISTNGDKNIKLSKQELVSCAQPQEKRCQEEMNIFEALKFVEERGLAREECMKYIARPGNCKYEEKCPMDLRVFVKDIQTFNKEGFLMQELFTGPVIASFEMYSDFYHYTGGIYKHTSGYYVSKHSVLIVGYSRGGNEDYWIAKNTFGFGWGEGGYFKIPFGHLNIESEAVCATPYIK
jgi:C1A family cysteine protease